MVDFYLHSFPKALAVPFDMRLNESPSSLFEAETAAPAGSSYDGPRNLIYRLPRYRVLCRQTAETADCRIGGRKFKSETFIVLIGLGFEQRGRSVI